MGAGVALTLSTMALSILVAASNTQWAARALVWSIGGLLLTVAIHWTARVWHLADRTTAYERDGVEP